MTIVHVDKMLRVVSDWRPLYDGERQKTVIHVQNTLKNLSNQTVELPTLYDKLCESPADEQTKKDAVKMVRVLLSASSRIEQLTPINFEHFRSQTCSGDVSYGS